MLNPAQAEQARAQGRPDKLASEDYIHMMRRLQANLQYMMQKQTTVTEKSLPGPAIMTPPPSVGGELGAMYERLQELFPEWQGLDTRGTPARTGSSGGSAQAVANGGQ